uniref:Uncharacterized protein n=1 Tax=Cacopsylla melanoneura TaxID=428564 RepID=A0A8D9AWF4_9HEMI
MLKPLTLKMPEKFADKVDSAYENQIPISAAKYKDLKKLCDKDIIAKHLQSEILLLPHSDNVREILPETDEEDEPVPVEVVTPTQNKTSKKKFPADENDCPPVKKKVGTRSNKKN